MLETETFLSSVISDPSLSIPIEANFVIGIANIHSIISNLNDQKNVVSDDKLNVNINFNELELQDDVYFATGVTLPGETITSGRAGFSTDNSLYGGLLSGPILKGRTDTGNLKITFIETNASFIDYVLRPWTVTAAQFGLFARTPKSKQNFKTDITISFLDKNSNSVGDSKIRKRLLFNKAVPTEVGGFSALYGTDKSTGLRTVETSWIYSTYTVI
jgi:hypothetical protein